MGSRTAARPRGGGLGARQRGLQLGLVAVGLGLVAVGDAVAQGLVVAEPGAASQRLAVLVATGSRALAGWAAGLALRLQLAPTASCDEQLRALLGAPLGFLAAWPIVVGLLPPALAGLLPAALAADGAVTGLQPVAAVLLGLVLALAVRRAGRR